MDFVVRGHHLDLTDSLKTRCRTVFDRAEKLVDNSAARLEIELGIQAGNKQGIDKSCRIDLRAPGLNPIHVTELRPHMNEAIDLAADKLVEALRRSIERRESTRRRTAGAAATGLPESVDPEEEDEAS